MGSIETASFYKRAIAAFDLPPEKAEKIAAQMTQLGVGHDDAYMLLFLATARAEQMTEAVPGEIRKAGKEVVAGINQVMNEGLKKELEALGPNLSSAMAAKLDPVISEIGSKAQAAIQREADRVQSYRLMKILAVAALAASLTFVIGYVVGRDAINSQAARWEALVNLPDGKNWLTVARLNDFNKTFAQSCALGQRKVISGGQKCEVELWVSQPVATSQGTDAVNLAFSEWSNRLGPWGLLGLGALLGAGLTWLKRKVAE